MRALVVVSSVLLAACSKGAAATNDTAPAPDAGPSAIDVVPVVSKPLDATTHLEAELAPYEAVALHARVNGFVQRVLVDRGSKVKRGALLATIVAPELIAQRARPRRRCSRTSRPTSGSTPRRRR